MIHDLSVRLHKWLGVKRRLPVEHLIHAHAERPPVTLRAVSPVPVLHRPEYLRGDVVGRTHGDRWLYL